MGSLNPKGLQTAFIKWEESYLGKPVGSYASFDGKSLRGSGDKELDILPLYQILAYSHEPGIVIGQMEYTCDKMNEITVCKELFNALKLEDAVITAEAIMYQKEFATKIARRQIFSFARDY